MTRYRPRLLLAAIALGGALGWAYQDTFGWILTGWRENPYFSHGPLVPLLTAALLWRLRHALLSAAWRTDWRGLAVVALAGLMFIGGRVIDLNYAVGLSLVVLLHGVTWTVAGPEVARLAFFPLSFLAFGVPLSQLVIHAYSFPLQLASARLATGTMNLLTGAQAYADGTLMRMDGLDYLVAVECSGFKALLGLTMVGVLAAYLTDTSRSRRIGIALLAAPIAVASNVVRLFLILIVGRLWGHEFAVTTFHDMSGLVMLVVAVAILMAVARVVVGPGADVAAAPAPAGSGERQVRLSWPPLAASTAVLLLCGGLGLALVPPAPPAPDVDLSKVPLRIGRWRGIDREIDPRVTQELGQVAIIQRAYTTAPDQAPVELIVICGRGRRSLHPPTACYIGAGHDLLEEQERLIPAAPEPLHFQRLIVGDGAQPAVMALYTFTDGTTTTPDYARHQRASLARGEVIWTQLHVATPWRGSLETTEAYLLPFLLEAWPEIRQTLPRGER